jgi:hypothetical protein
MTVAQAPLNKMISQKFLGLFSTVLFCAQVALSFDNSRFDNVRTPKISDAFALMPLRSWPCKAVSMQASSLLTVHIDTGVKTPTAPGIATLQISKSVSLFTVDLIASLMFSPSRS